jgi:hypothetical protein
MKKLFFVSMMMLSSLVNAQHIPVQGSVDCGMWLDARDKKVALALENFSVGLVNGLALGTGVDIWGGKGYIVNQSQLHYWMDQYCKKNPVSGVLQGTYAFADEMTGGKFSIRIKK